MKKIILIFALVFMALCAVSIATAWSSTPPTTQCTAITKKGTQCKLHTTSLNGLCHLHGGTPVKASATTTQCTATTKAGNRCKLHTSNANGLCHIHTTKQ